MSKITTTSNDDLVKEYINQLTPLELQTYKIALEHLETSFSIEKSIGFLNWKAKKSKSKSKSNH